MKHKYYLFVAPALVCACGGTGTVDTEDADALEISGECVLESPVYGCALRKSVRCPGLLEIEIPEGSQCVHVSGKFVAHNEHCVPIGEPEHRCDRYCEGEYLTLSHSPAPSVLWVRVDETGYCSDCCGPPTE